MWGQIDWGEQESSIVERYGKTRQLGFRGLPAERRIGHGSPMVIAKKGMQPTIETKSADVGARRNTVPSRKIRESYRQSKTLH